MTRMARWWLFSGLVGTVVTLGFLAACSDESAPSAPSAPVNTSVLLAADRRIDHGTLNALTTQLEQGDLGREADDFRWMPIRDLKFWYWPIQNEAEVRDDLDMHFWGNGFIAREFESSVVLLVRNSPSVQISSDEFTITEVINNLGVDQLQLKLDLISISGLDANSPHGRVLFVQDGYVLFSGGIQGPKTLAINMMLSDDEQAEARELLTGAK